MIAFLFTVPGVCTTSNPSVLLTPEFASLWHRCPLPTLLTHPTHPYLVGNKFSVLHPSPPVPCSPPPPPPPPPLPRARDKVKVDVKSLSIEPNMCPLAKEVEMAIEFEVEDDLKDAKW